MHLIQQHTMDISCASTDFGKEVQNVVAALLEKELYPKLELLLNLYSFQNYTWKIDKLEITLPPLSKKKWKEEIVTHSLEQIEFYLKMHFENFEQNPSIIENSEIVFTKNSILESLFFDFLQKGILSENGLIKNLEELIASVEVNESFIQKLKDLFIKNPKALIRFILAFSEEFKTKIVTQIDDSQSELITVLQFALASKANSFPGKAIENWIEFMAWQFYFFKEKMISNSTLYNTVKTITSQYWDIESDYLLILKELLITEKGLHKKYILLQKNDFIAFWNIFLNTLDSLNSKEESVSEEINTSEIKKKTKLETPDSKTQNMIYVKNAGLILFHPFLKSLFEQLELTKNDIWTSKMSQHKAILLTQFLISGETKIGENELVLNKILCGFPIENVVNTQLEITPKEIEKCESLLNAVIEHWKILGDTSVAGLRETFLQREGKILFTENEKLELWVKQEGVDILLAQLPWGIEMIKTPWMEDFLQCYWN
ncbi:contractile injection system tape measure protein [Flavobacterium sp. M31R6]|uniref:contractile injection system tape measure protein n=1 Tax=Flavobacterium sp. M31R6 TaxID=2739062 RepID=UPI001567E3BC|nr:contractile injection system tape measure protein [Flavobacterium sp. M31R6]QKJ61851.1 hypothetical protein HQN62_01495 [Flavobacterium sp. M31R6]